MAADVGRLLPAAGRAALTRIGPLGSEGRSVDVGPASTTAGPAVAPAVVTSVELCAQRRR